MRKYWLYAPGDRAAYWDEFYDSGIIGLGWDKIGDLAQYESEEEIREALIRADGREGTRKNDVAANWDFMYRMQPGDVVIAKRGRYHYIGYGIITSDYYYDSSRKVYQKCRKITWKKKGSWEETEKAIVLKTLTDITHNTAYVEKLVRLIGIE